MADEKRIWRIIPDTSVIIDGRLSSRIKSGEFGSAEVIIPEAVVSELEAQANKGREIGFKGLEELSELRKLADRGGIFNLSLAGGFSQALRKLSFPEKEEWMPLSGRQLLTKEGFLLAKTACSLL